MICCWQAADFTTLGAMFNTCLKIGIFCHASFIPLGGSGSFRNASNSPTPRSASTDSSPMPIATRSAVPNKFAKTGI